MKYFIYGMVFCLFAAIAESKESPIVINEIMYHSSSDLDEDEFVELFNRGDESVDLSGWFFSDGIRYSFPPGTILDAGDYLVVAKSAAKIRGKYGLDEVWGNYFGELSNEGERVALANIDGEVVDEVEYSDSPPWPVSADEYGPSLECINPDEDNARPAAWSVAFGNIGVGPSANGVIQDKAVWPMEYRHTPNGNQQIGVHFSQISIPIDPSRRIIRLRLPDEPRIYVFAVTLQVGGEMKPVNLSTFFDVDGISRADNASDGNLDGSGSTFAAELLPSDGAIRLGGNISSPVEFTLGSYLDGENNAVPCDGHMISVPREMGSQNLHILATAVNAETVAADFVAIYTDGEESVTVRVTDWAVPVSEIDFTLSGEGTPGKRNSVYQETLPPFVEEYSHHPERPLSTDVVTVRARVSCGEAIDTVRLHYWAGDEDGWLEMNDEGRDGDDEAGDGEYAVQLDPQKSQTVVFYSIRVVDALGRERYSPLETDPTPRHGYLVYDGEVPSDLPIYFLFIDDASMNQLNPNTDNMVPAVVAVDGRVFDGVRVRYRGAWARSWPKKNWKVRFNKGAYYKGWRTSNLNGEYHDRAYMREKIGYELFEDAGVPHPQARFVWMQLNGEPFGLYCEIEQPDERFLERIGRDGASLYKSEGRYNVLGSESQYVQAYQKETNVQEPYTSLIEMIEEVNAISDERVYEYFVQHFNVDGYIDYLVVNACISNWDSIVKNHMVVQDVALTGKWEFIPWDLDRTWGEFPDTQLYFNQDILAGILGHPGPQLGNDWWNRVQNRFFNNEIFLRMYYSRMRQFLQTKFTEERMGALIDECDALIRDETPLERQIHGLHGSWNYPDEVENLKQYVRQRREFLFQSMPVDVGDWQLY